MCIRDSNNIWNDVRQQALQGKEISGCWRCYHDEKLGIKSMRQSALETTNEISYDYTVDPNYNETELEFLEIQTGRYCNLKCRSCGPKLSTTWDEDLDKDDRVIQNFFGNNTQHYIDIKSKSTLSKLTSPSLELHEELLADVSSIRMTYRKSLAAYDFIGRETMKMYRTNLSNSHLDNACRLNDELQNLAKITVLICRFMQTACRALQRV